MDVEWTCHVAAFCAIYCIANRMARVRMQVVITPLTGLLLPFPADTNPPLSACKTGWCLLDYRNHYQELKVLATVAFVLFWCMHLCSFCTGFNDAASFCQQQLSNLLASAALMTLTAWLSSCHGNAVKERLYRSRGVHPVKPMTQVCHIRKASASSFPPLFYGNLQK